MLVANQSDINLGALTFGVPHNFKFVVTNKYDKPLTILKLNAGCTSCTSATASKAVLAPGESADIDVLYTPGSSGNSLKSLNVFHTVDGNVKPDLTLKFRATVSK